MILGIVSKKTAIVAGVTALLLCAVSEEEALAQRTMRGESLVTASYQHLFQDAGVHGAEVSYGQYLSGSYWKAGVRGSDYMYTPETSQPFRYQHLAAYGEWMYRLAATRGRTLNLYGGGGAFMGVETVDIWSPKRERAREGFEEEAFLYGVSISAEAELFLSRRLALVLSGTLPLNFSSQFGWFHCQVGAGLRVNL